MAIKSRKLKQEVQNEKKKTFPLLICLESFLFLHPTLPLPLETIPTCFDLLLVVNHITELSYLAPNLSSILLATAQLEEEKRDIPSVYSLGCFFTKCHDAF